MDINNLFKEDQKNIRLYKQNRISAQELRTRSKTISDKFLRILKEKGFPCKERSSRKKRVPISCNFDSASANWEDQKNL